jgi:hypothetical protein
MIDGIRFDSVTRTLATTGSRRGAFRTMAAAGLGLGLTRLGPGRATAKNKGKKKKKRNLGDRCSKTDQCKGKYLCKLSNSQNSCYDETERRCCVKEGGSCDDSCDCCGVDVICNGGFCQDA